MLAEEVVDNEYFMLGIFEQESFSFSYFRFFDYLLKPFVEYIWMSRYGPCVAAIRDRKSRFSQKTRFSISFWLR